MGQAQGKPMNGHMGFSLSSEQLSEHAPLPMWREAIKQAQRSDHRRHRTGCVIFDGDTIHSRGCSHTHNGGLKVRSVHAEMDAISKCQPSPSGSVYYKAVIVTLTKGNNFAQVSKPCEGCARLLRTRVSTVIYAEKNNDLSWRVETRLVSSLESLKATRYA